MDRQPAVLNVIGRGRSGTTLLGNLIGQTPGFFHAGELRRIWGQLSAPTNSEEIPCSCGAAVRDCVMWSEVAERLRSDPNLPEPPETVAAWRAELSGKRAWRIFTGSRFLSSGIAREYTRAVRALHRAIAATTDAHVLVDISKEPIEGLMLRARPQVPHALIHMVRDPRAVMHSWTRVKRWPDGRTPEMRRYAPRSSALRWVAYNLLAEYVRRSPDAGPSLVVRYEDLVADPNAVLRTIGTLLGEPVEELTIEDDVVTLPPGHVLGANPGKFTAEPVHLREDDEWRHLMPARHRALGTVLTLPLLRRYRYPIRAGAPSAGTHASSW